MSGSADNTCIIWDYQAGNILHTFLLPATPLCLTLDPADRAFYAGYEDGSIQLVDIFKQKSLVNTAHNPALTTTPTQPPPEDRWSLNDTASAARSLTISYDGTIVLSGHDNGKVHEWDVGMRRCGANSSDYFAPVTNLLMLPPQGFPSKPTPTSRLLTVVKPRYESTLGGSGTTFSASELVPENYMFSAQFMSSLPLPCFQSQYGSSLDPLSSFDTILDHPSFPCSLLDEGVASLNVGHTANRQSGPESNTEAALREEIRVLKIQVAVANIAKDGFAEDSEKVGREIQRLKNTMKYKRRAKIMARAKRARIEERKRKLAMGEQVDEEEEREDEELSSSTDEMAESD